MQKVLTCWRQVLRLDVRQSRCPPHLDEVLRFADVDAWTFDKVDVLRTTPHHFVDADVDAWMKSSAPHRFADVDAWTKSRRCKKLTGWKQPKASECKKLTCWRKVSAPHRRDFIQADVDAVQKEKNLYQVKWVYKFFTRCPLCGAKGEKRNLFKRCPLKKKESGAKRVFLFHLYKSKMQTQKQKEKIFETVKKKKFHLYKKVKAGVRFAVQKVSPAGKAKRKRESRCPLKKKKAVQKSFTCIKRESRWKLSLFQKAKLFQTVKAKKFHLLEKAPTLRMQKKKVLTLFFRCPLKKKKAVQKKLFCFCFYTGESKKKNFFNSLLWSKRRCFSKCLHIPFSKRWFECCSIWPQETTFSPDLSLVLGFAL